MIINNYISGEKLGGYRSSIFWTKYNVICTFIYSVVFSIVFINHNRLLFTYIIQYHYPLSAIKIPFSPL